LEPELQAGPGRWQGLATIGQGLSPDNLSSRRLNHRGACHQQSLKRFSREIHYPAVPEYEIGIKIGK
jgi:hypothetical protein